jgi:TRAP transporter TAXI family solute receptor
MKGRANHSSPSHGCALAEDECGDLPGRDSAPGRRSRPREPRPGHHSSPSHGYALAQADVEFEAVDGLAHWKKRGPQPGLRSVFSLYTESITVVATPDSGIRTTRDLIGKRIDIGHPDSGARRSAVDALDALGVDWRTGTDVYEETPDDRASLYLQGKLDAFFHTVGHPTMDIRFAVNSVPGARLVALDNISELLERHGYYSISTIPIGLYPGLANEGDVETVGIKTLFLTSAEAPDDVVYTLTRAVFEVIESLGEYDEVLKGVTSESMIQGSSAPLHRGAAR